MSEQNNTSELSELLQIRRDKLAQLRESGNDPFELVKYDVDVYTRDIMDNFENYEGKSVSLGGRLMSKRGMGKASFCDLQDRYGRIQIYVRKDAVGDESYDMFKKYDIGDIVGIKGEVFKTHTGEISVKASEVTLLSKSLLPLPEKFHGLKDT